MATFVRKQTKNIQCSFDTPFITKETGVIWLPTQPRLQGLLAFQYGGGILESEKTLRTRLATYAGSKGLMTRFFPRPIVLSTVEIENYLTFLFVCLLFNREDDKIIERRQQ